MRFRTLVAAAAAVLLFGSTALAEIDISKALCPVSGKACKADTGVDHNGGKVFFCCMNCPKAYAKNPAKFATKANLQLVATAQAKQSACPITGKKLNPKTTLAVSGVDVQFCCNGCRKKVDGAEGADQLKLVFGADAFKKAFAKIEKK